MSDSYNKLSKILRTPPEVLLDMDKKMAAITGKNEVIEKVMGENDILVRRTLDEFGLSFDSSAEEVYSALIKRLIHLDEHLFKLLDEPDLSKPDEATGKISHVAFNIFNHSTSPEPIPPKGFFIKKEKVAQLLEEHKPESLLNHFNCSSMAELFKKEDFSSIVSSLRFTQSTEWMHEFFEKSYSNLKPDDFEEREVEIKVLGGEWIKVADKFLEKKFHNISHLKEFGVIFVIPIPIDTPGETTRMFTLVLHYLHEVPFYSEFFRKFIKEENFADKFKSLLRGDVSEEPLPSAENKVWWRVVQRYLAKDNELDFRLFEPHVNPEAEHWFKVGEDLGKLEVKDGGANLGYWHGLDFVGDFFKDISGAERLVSFDLIDLIMSLTKKSEIKYLYHQEEAMWNKIFLEYVGRDKMHQLIQGNLIKGFIEL